MADKLNFKESVAAMFEGMDTVVSSKTVVGDPIKIEDVTIVPLVDVSFGLGVGSTNAEKKDKGMGGVGGKITPSAVLVIKDNTTRLVNIRNQDTMTKILDMVPELLDRLQDKKEDEVTEEDVNDILSKGKKATKNETKNEMKKETE